MTIGSTMLKGAAAAVLIAVSATSAHAMSPEGLLARGGQLYDWWYKVTTGDMPSGKHAAYPDSGSSSGKNTWRCSTCHGYGYTGDEGMKGIGGSAGKDAAAIIAVLRDKNHNYTDGMFGENDFKALAAFVGKGQTDVAKAIKSGNATRGQGYFETICSVCHGLDGKKITDMPPVGAVVSKLPDRSLHRIRFGKPGADMPAMAALPLDVSIDVLAYTLTLPQ